MPATTLYTTPSAYSILEDAVEEREMDWDRRLTVLEGRWESVTAARAQFARNPWRGFWPETVKAKKTWGGLVRVEIEAAGLAGAEKFYEVTEDNGELMTYQLTGNGAGVQIYAAGWVSTVVYRAVNVEIGVPRYGIIGFSGHKPDPAKNGHGTAAPFRGIFPTITAPPWRYVGNDAGHTANFPGGWRQVAAQSKMLGGFAAGAVQIGAQSAAFSPALYRGVWAYAHVEKQTI
jgi:hypothetical protein